MVFKARDGFQSVRKRETILIPGYKGFSSARPPPKVEICPLHQSFPFHSFVAHCCFLLKHLSPEGLVEKLCDWNVELQMKFGCRETCLYESRFIFFTSKTWQTLQANTRYDWETKSKPGHEIRVNCLSLLLFEAFHSWFWFKLLMTSMLQNWVLDQPNWNHLGTLVKFTIDHPFSCPSPSFHPSSRLSFSPWYWWGKWRETFWEFGVVLSAGGVFERLYDLWKDRNTENWRPRRKKTAQHRK